MLSNHYHKVNIVVQQPGDVKSFEGFFRDITPEQILKGQRSSQYSERKSQATSAVQCLDGGDCQSEWR
jgi:hypothetical protein